MSLLSAAILFPFCFKISQKEGKTAKQPKLRGICPKSSNNLPLKIFYHDAELRFERFSLLGSLTGKDA
ncbi:MAG: hypothetical protein II188_00025, partial [Ruminococcus sp.]|nr:hypothetical protein [Ruminococcus sp.]